jgi:hypothetical protein
LFRCHSLLCMRKRAVCGLLVRSDMHKNDALFNAEREPQNPMNAPRASRTQATGLQIGMRVHKATSPCPSPPPFLFALPSGNLVMFYF